MKFESFIWDLGGTLLDNYVSSSQAFLRTLEQEGRTADLEEIYASLKEATDVAILRYAAGIPDFRRKYRLEEAKELAQPVLFPGIPQLLEELQAAGAQHFLVSHRDKQVIEILKATGILSYFTEIVTSDQGFARKPSPEAFLYLKNKYHLENTLVIGDRPMDMIAGQNAGMATYLFDSAPQLAEFIKRVEESDG